MRLALLALLVACSGAPKSEPDAAADAAPPTVTGKYRLRVVHNNAQRMPVVDEVAYHSLYVTVKLADGTTPPVDVADDGTFTFTRHAEDERYEVTIIADGGLPLTYVHTAANLDLSPRLWGRYDREPAPAGTALAVTLNPPAPGIAFVDSTGLWTQSAATSGIPNNFMIDWSKSGSLSGPIGLIDATQYDRLYIVNQDTAGTSPPYYRITQACAVDIRMVGGATTPASCTLAAAPGDHCAHVVAKAATEYARISAAVAAGPAYPSGSWNWILDAQPAPQVGPGGGPFLAFVGEGNAPAADVDRMVTFAQPFPGHTVSGQMSVGSTRALMLPGTTTAVALSVLTTNHVIAAPDCASPTDVTPTIAIPALPVLDGTIDLDSDTVTTALDHSKPHELSWSSSSGTPADYYVVLLFGVSDAAGATQLAFERGWVTTEPKVTIQPDALPPGHHIIEIVANQQYPNAAGGDFRTLGFPATPQANATVWSGMFEVTR